MAGAATIVEREFLRGQRRWQTFAFRGGFALAMLVFFAMQYREMTRWQDWGAPGDLAYMGQGLFKWVMYTQWWLLGLLTPILVTQGIVEENNQGTLDLLAISNISPSALIRGKVFASLSQVGLLVLAGMPIVALSLGLGGVSPASLVLGYACTLVGALSIASFAAFYALFARGPLGPLALSWWTVFFGWLVMAFPAIIARDGYDGFAWMSLAYAFFEGIDAPQWFMFWPVVLWAGLSFAVLHLAGRVFATLLASRQGEDPDAVLLSVEVWELERLRRRQALRALILFFTAPLPVLSHLENGGNLLLLIPSFVWVQLALFTALVAVLLTVRRVLLKLGSLVGKRRLSAGEKAALVEADGPRRRGQRLPGAREVWGNPVAWRETMTRAHGFLTTFAGRAYILGLVLFTCLLLVHVHAGDEYVDDELLVAGAAGGFLGTAALAVLLSTASMVAEQRRGTLALLCVSPMGAGRILGGKLLGLVPYLLPPFALASVCALLGAAELMPRYRWWSSVPDTDLLLLRTAFTIWCAFAGTLFLASSSLYLAVRAKTAGRAWLLTLGNAATLALLPVAALASVRGKGWVADAVAWFNPLLSESFWEDDVPRGAVLSGAIWVVASIVLLVQNARTLRRVAR